VDLFWWWKALHHIFTQDAFQVAKIKKMATVNRLVMSKKDGRAQLCFIVKNGRKQRWEIPSLVKLPSKCRTPKKCKKYLP